jgi:hypothetical protein
VLAMDGKRIARLIVPPGPTKKQRDKPARDRGQA